MKSIKTMLLGIALLIIACCCVPFWVAGAGIGAVLFFIFLIFGLILCFKGYFDIK
jgi:hypothetical protein